jgi:hypothetical protein
MYLVNNGFHWLLDNSTLWMKNGADPSGRAVCGRSFAGITGSNPPGAWMSVSCERCVLLGRDLCDGPIPLSEESYQVCVCMFVCVIECDQLQR